MQTLALSSPAQTAALGRHLAMAMAEAPFSLLMTGGLGMGKTTLTRALVEALPGGSEAEISSPSFTLCNIYPTEPAVVHCDLYRQGTGSLLPDEVHDMLADGAVLVCEWSEYLARADLPADYVLLHLDAGDGCEESRTARLEACGPNASACLAELATASL